MHPESHELMEGFALKYLDRTAHLSIVDVGSEDVNGTYRDIFERPNWAYYGLGLEKGKNVDMLWVEALGRKFDIAISGSVLEHVRMPWLWILNVRELVKPGGLICIIAPSEWEYHEYPIDCWRVFPEGLEALFEYARLEPLETSNHPGKAGNDTYGVARRNE